jgi:hypothetical protein
LGGRSASKGGIYLKNKRNSRKQTLIDLKGGKCKKCGYKKSLSALGFHHKEPMIKLFNISGKNLYLKSMDELIKEAEKCDLLCANCHAELHDEEGWINQENRTLKAKSEKR